MRTNGYGNPQILALATELIDLVTRDMRGEGEESLDAKAAGHTSDVELKIVGHSA
jgi:hypothetical protein